MWLILRSTWYQVETRTQFHYRMWDETLRILFCSSERYKWFIKFSFSRSYKWQNWSIENKHRSRSSPFRNYNLDSPFTHSLSPRLMSAAKSHNEIIEFPMEWENRWKYFLRQNQPNSRHNFSFSMSNSTELVLSNVFFHRITECWYFRKFQKIARLFFSSANIYLQLQQIVIAIHNPQCNYRYASLSIHLIRTLSE